ncbi:p5 [Emaravirus cajani]|uniref:p5 n=1 Tax=Emaravirus cajani TaxID=1980429 RepID=U6E7B1_9VIRU|nr:p5 [Emaravirus cajani]CCW28369.2 p5 [Emaravirus cajani]
MESIVPFCISKKEVINNSNYEKLKPNKNLGRMERIIYDMIKDEYNRCNAVEKGMFCDDFNMIPINSCIGYMEIGDDIPTYVYAIKKGAYFKGEFQYAVIELSDAVSGAINSILYSAVIRDFEGDMDTLYITVKGSLPIKEYFIIVKIENKQTLIQRAKSEWANILSSTSLVGTDSIVSHYREMTRFCYRIIKNQSDVGSVYSMISENQHLVNHVLPSLTMYLTSYNSVILEHVKNHIKRCYESNDYNLIFRKDDIECDHLTEPYIDEGLKLEISNAIYNDVTLRLREIKNCEAEAKYIKKNLFRSDNNKIISDFEAVTSSETEMIKYLPGTNEAEDFFQYGLPEHINIARTHLENSMVKRITDANMIDDVDYIPSYPFTTEFKKVVFESYRIKNKTVKMSHLGLHYACLYIYFSIVSTRRAGYERFNFDHKLIEKSRKFAKVNIEYLRFRIQTVRTVSTPINNCVTITLKKNL